MKRSTLILIGLLCQIFVHGQGPKKATIPLVGNELKTMLTLQMPDGSGSNGASVAWHSKQKKYYAAFAGNADYPLAVFSETGKKLSGDMLNTMIDMRGLWYNQKTGTLQCNGYNESGWYEYKLDAAGVPIGKTTIMEGLHQPESQSIGVFDNQNDIVYFLSATPDEYKIAIEKYNQTGANIGKTNITLSNSSPENNDEIMDGYNTSAIAFTGILGQEIALLNVKTAKIELYNATNGTFVKFLKIPESISLEENFNFSYANGYYWFFNKANRRWIGCK